MIFRSPLGRRGEMGIAPAPLAAFCRQETLIRFCEIKQKFVGFGVEHLRSDRDLHRPRFAVLPGTIRAFAMAAAFCLVLGIISKVEQGVQAFVRLDPDIAADTAVASRGAAAWNEFLAAKRRNAVSAVAGLHLYLGPINEHVFILQ